MELSKLQSRVSFSSSSSSRVPPHKTQLHPRMQPFSSIAPPPNSKPFQSATTNPHKYLFLFISISLLPFLIYLLSLYRSIHISSKFTPSASDVYGLIIHIDQYKSHVRVFKSLNEGSQAPFVGDGSDWMWFPDGYSGDSGVEGFILKMVEFAGKKIPRSQRKSSVVLFLVGGGLDYVGTVELGIVKEVLEVGRRVLRSSGFSLKDEQATVLGGEDEGVYSWVALNHMLGNLGSKPHETSGIVKIGEASVQVTYATRLVPREESNRTIRLAGVTYNLHTQSLPDFSQAAVWKLLQEQQNPTTVTSLNPCIPKGYEEASHTSDVLIAVSHAAGNFSRCRSQVRELLMARKGQCSSTTCKTMPALPMELKANTDTPRSFFLSSKLLGSVPMNSLTELEDSGRHFCEDSWDNLKSRHQDTDDEDLLRSCFSHAYALSVLQDTLGIPKEKKRVSLKTETLRVPVDWELGAFVSQMVSEPLKELETTEIQDQIVGHESITYFTLFGVLLVIVSLAAIFVMKLRKPQFKTIYDLEKGRYIITRVAG